MGMTTHERRQSLGRLNGRAAADESAVYGLSESISASERYMLWNGTLYNERLRQVNGEAATLCQHF
jgi:hypothetical protein